MRTRITAVVVPFLLLACEGGALAPGTESGEAPIQTDRLQYVLTETDAGWSAEIGYAFTNRTGRAVTVAHCAGAYSLKLQQRRAGGWVDAWPPLLPLCLSVPVVIEPGADRAGTVWFIARPNDFEVDRVAGVYRIVWTGVFFDSSGGEVPLWARVSNAFELVLPS